MIDRVSSSGRLHPFRNLVAIEVAIMIFSFASFATIGLSLVVTSWIAALEGSISLVGQLFFTSSATSLFFSLYAGVVTDRSNRLAVIRSGQVLRFLGVAALAIGVLGSHATPWLFAYAVMFSMGTSLNAGALDGIVQLAVNEQRRMTLSIRVSICRQLGILFGTGLGGLALHYLPAIWSVLTMVVLLFVQLVIIARFLSKYPNVPSKSSENVVHAWKAGIRAILKDRTLAFTILNVGLFFSASQMANVLVPGFVKDTLQEGSDVYGLLETAWAVGGSVVLFTAAAQSRLFSAQRTDLIILIAVGAAMVVFVASRNIPVLILIYGILGGLFSLGRAICDGRILIITKQQEIGRVRAATSMVISVLGMAIYLSPTVIGIQNTIFYYVIWGVLLSAAGSLMLFLGNYYDRRGRTT